MTPTRTGAPAGPLPGEMLVAARCWACDVRLVKAVRRRPARPRHVSWSCHHCDVAWSGPATEAVSA